MLAVEHKPGFTMRQAARIAGIHEKVIYQWVKEGRIQAFSGVDGRMMISEAELYHWIRNQHDM